VQKQTFGEVKTRTVIQWQVMSKMFASKIIIIFFKSQLIMLGMFFDKFLFISTYISLVLLFPGREETDAEGGGIWNSHFMASCARNVCTKNY